MSLSQEIESKINIVDLVSRYVSLKKSGANYKGLSPFVTEKTPSFVVSPAKNLAYCFSSHRGGGPIRFLMEVEQIEFREAVAILAKEAGVEMATTFSRDRGEKTEDIYLLHKKAAEWYHQCLFLSESQKALGYLTDRQMSRETIERFQLGYSGDSRDMWYAMKDAGFSDDFLIESGIFLSSSRDKFFGRIVFPITNYLGHVVGFTARVLGDGMPKYLNSPATKIFDKSAILYGLHLAKAAIAKTGDALIVEGQMDTIALHQAGVEIAVGISGTALTTDHIRVLRRFTRRIYLALDSDRAGVEATFRSIENLVNENIDLQIMAIPNGKDPDEYLKSGGRVEDLFAQAISPLTFFLREGSRKYDMSSIVGKKQLIQECLDFLIHIQSHSEIDMYLREISLHLGVSLDSLHADLRDRTRRSKEKKSYEKAPNESRNPPLQYTIFDTFGVFIARFGLFDLFSENFRYTLQDLSPIGELFLLSAILTHQELSPDLAEKKSIIDLTLDEELTGVGDEVIQQKFFDMLRVLHRTLFLSERSLILDSLDSRSSEYLTTYQVLMKKARELGLSQEVMK